MRYERSSERPFSYTSPFFQLFYGRNEGRVCIHHHALSELLLCKDKKTFEIFAHNAPASVINFLIFMSA